MGFKTHDGVVAIHAATVVGDLNEPLATLLRRDANTRRACVNGILNEFLDDGGGTLHDFAGGDAPCDFC